MISISRYLNFQRNVRSVTSIIFRTRVQTVTLCLILRHTQFFHNKSLGFPVTDHSEVLSYRFRHTHTFHIGVGSSASPAVVALYPVDVRPAHIALDGTQYVRSRKAITITFRENCPIPRDTTGEYRKIYIERTDGTVRRSSRHAEGSETGRPRLY